MSHAPLHLFGPLAHAVAPLLTRMGVQVTTDPPTEHDVTQLYCHSGAHGNMITTGRDLHAGHAQAPAGIVASWAVEPEHPKTHVRDLYRTRVQEAFPLAETGTGIAGLLSILATIGRNATLSLDAILPPHSAPDPNPACPPAHTRHTASIPDAMVAGPTGVGSLNRIHRARLMFWQLTAALRDEWLLSPHTHHALEMFARAGCPIHSMLWHRGTETRPEIVARFAGDRNPLIHKAWLRGAAAWGDPVQLAAARVLSDVAAHNRIDRIASALGGALHADPSYRHRTHDEGGLSVLRLVERDATFRESLVANTPLGSRPTALQKLADTYLSTLGLPLRVEADHPEHTVLTAFLTRMAPRAQARTKDGIATLPDGEVLTEDDDPAAGLARLSDTATRLSGRVWQQGEIGGQVEFIVGAWGARASVADDLTMADWLQSFRGPTRLLACVANGVLQWPTLSPATVTGITRVAAVSKSLDTYDMTDLIGRIPSDQVPEEWRTIAADAGKAPPVQSSARIR